MPENESDRLAAQSHLELDRRIRERAHQIWLSRGGQEDGPDKHLEDWLQAEREVLGDSPKNSAMSRGATIGNAHKPDAEQMEELSGREDAAD